MITLKQVEKSYPDPAAPGRRLTVLRLERLELEGGARAALAGPSGSGKTTLLHLLAGLIQPSQGEIWVAGRPLHRLSEVERDRLRACQIGLLFQTFMLLPGYSALENVRLALSLAGKIERNRQEARARELLEKLGLQDRLHHRPRQLSAGQQQRVALARALANRPALLLADEPTASVDAVSAGLIMDLLLEAAGEDNATLLVASHDRLALDRLPRRIELDHAGRLAALAPEAG